MTTQRFSIVPAHAVSDPNLTDSEYRTLSAVATYADKNGWCWPSQSKLAEIRGVSRKTINQHVKRLNSLGYLNVIARAREDGGQTSNMMQVKMDYPYQPDEKTPLLRQEVTPPVTSEGYTPCNSQEVTPPVTSEGYTNTTINNTDNTKEEESTPPPAKPKPRHIANMEARDELANLSPTLQAMATAVSDVCKRPVDASILEHSYQLIGMDATPELVRELFSGAGCYWLTKGAGAWHDGNGRVYPKNIVNDWHWALQWKENHTSGGAWAELYAKHIAPLQSVDGAELKERVRLLPFDIKERLSEIGVKQAGQIARLSLAQFAGGG